MLKMYNPEKKQRQMMRKLNKERKAAMEGPNEDAFVHIFGLEEKDKDGQTLAVRMKKSV